VLLSALTLTLLACGGDDTTTTGDSAGTTATDSGTTAGTTDTDTGPAEVHDLSVQELKAWLDDGKDFLFINVHVPHAGEIPGTDVHIAYTDTDDLVAEIGSDLERLTVVYCLSGPMSAQAAGDLVDLGYRDVYDLPEAMNGWEDAGYELSD
jgi:rhodanese-related sulfurtransferase